ncbi:hypothetical protein P8452_13392 [Trifolium repens]|nr:hypothetical protein P8452_13392 [Trifolium repens]
MVSLTLMLLRLKEKEAIFIKSPLESTPCRGCDNSTMKFDKGWSKKGRRNLSDHHWSPLHAGMASECVAEIVTDLNEVLTNKVSSPLHQIYRNTLKMFGVPYFLRACPI